MKPSQKRIVWLIFLVSVSVFVFYFFDPTGYFSVHRIIDDGLSHLARAETAQTPDEVIQHVMIVKNLFPISTSVSWWSKIDFASIQNELDTIIARTENITLLEPDNGQWISEMYGVHADIRAIEGKLLKEACSPFC